MTQQGILKNFKGDTFSFSFTSEDGYYLAWLRVGNTKIYSSEEMTVYSGSFNKNLTIHAHFKKDKDYTAEENESYGLTEDEDGSGSGDDVTATSEKNNNGNG